MFHIEGGIVVLVSLLKGSKVENWVLFGGGLSREEMDEKTKKQTQEKIADIHLWLKYDYNPLTPMHLDHSMVKTR